MIVTCEECSTSFQLDESLIPASGAQVRCSRCKHAFFLANPSASQSEAHHAIAEEAAGDPTAGVPPVASDSEMDEEEWQFSKEVRIEGDDSMTYSEGIDVSAGLADDGEADALTADASAEEVESAASSSPASDLDGDDSDARAESGLELDSSPGSSAPARDESAFGTVADFSSLMDDDDSVKTAVSAIAASGSAAEPSASAEAGASLAGAATDDLGDPESWDLVGDDSPPAPRPTMVTPSVGISRDLPSVDLALGAESDESFYTDDRVGPPAWLLRGGVLIGHGIGWVVTLALIAGVSYHALRSEWGRWIQSPQSAAMGTLQAETSRIRWVETSRAGFVMAVEGEMRNTGPTEQRAGVVQLSLLDAQGRPLSAEPIVAGEPLPERTLRESSRRALLSHKNTAVARLRSTPLAPGEVRPFVAIALEDELPREASRVLLEISDGSETRRPALDSRAESGAEEVVPADEMAEESAEAEDRARDDGGERATSPVQVEEESVFSP